MLNKTLEEIKKYKELIADIREIDFKIEQCEECLIGIDKKQLDIKLSKTNNINSMVEKALENKEILLIEKSKMKMRLKRIDNALSILTDEEREIMQIIYVEHRRYYVIQDKLNLSYQRIKQLEKQATSKMEKYILVD